MVKKKVCNWKPLSIRPQGRPKNRWEDDVRNDMKKTAQLNLECMGPSRVCGGPLGCMGPFRAYGPLYVHKT